MVEFVDEAIDLSHLRDGAIHEVVMLDGEGKSVVDIVLEGVCAVARPKEISSQCEFF